MHYVLPVDPKRRRPLDLNSWHDSWRTAVYTTMTNEPMPTVSTFTFERQELPGESVDDVRSVVFWSLNATFNPGLLQLPCATQHTLPTSTRENRFVKLGAKIFTSWDKAIRPLCLIWPINLGDMAKLLIEDRLRSAPSWRLFLYPLPYSEICSESFQRSLFRLHKKTNRIEIKYSRIEIKSERNSVLGIYTSLSSKSIAATFSVRHGPVNAPNPVHEWACATRFLWPHYAT